MSDEPATTDARLMTVDRLRELLAELPGHLEVFVNAVDDDGHEVFAAVKDAFQDLTCEGPDICRLFADREDDDAR